MSTFGLIYVSIELLWHPEMIVNSTKVPFFRSIHSMFTILLRLPSWFLSTALLQVLRLEPHIVVSNNTGVPLQLLQCRPVLAAPSSDMAGGWEGRTRKGGLPDACSMS